MIEWYMSSSPLQRATLFLIVGCFCTVMYACFRSLTRSHNHVTWYRGIHATPAFQLLMWIGVLPLVIPAVILIVRRKRALKYSPFIGNLRSRIFHTRECEYQHRINSDLLRYPFESEDEAVRCRFKPCNWCMYGSRG